CLSRVSISPKPLLSMSDTVSEILARLATVKHSWRLDCQLSISAILLNGFNNLRRLSLTTKF
ncbi:MAG: hypothetical protein ABI417_16150, partial [Coleofasciculaceae cyanobacterium]